MQLSRPGIAAIDRRRTATLRKDLLRRNRRGRPTAHQPAGSPRPSPPAMPDFFPAMSKALPCATDENRMGVPIARPAVWFGASSFAGDVSLIVQHHNESVALLVKHRVGAERTGHVKSCRLGVFDRGIDDFDFLAAKQAAFARMRVEPADNELRRMQCQARFSAASAERMARPTRSRVDQLDRLRQR